MSTASHLSTPVADRAPRTGLVQPDPFLRLELRRLLRNRRTLIFTLVMPPVVLPDLRHAQRPVRR